MPATNKNNKIPFRIIRYIVFTANIIAILALFLSVLAWYIPPEKTTLFSYLGLGFIFILIVNILFTLLWIVFLKWKYALVSFLAMAICICPILTYFPLHSKSKEIPAESIKVLSYNVMGFSTLIKTDPDKNPILAYIKDSNADIVCIQEFLMIEDIRNKSKERIENALKQYPYRSYVKLESIYNTRKHIYGLACFSKFPILSTTKLPIETNSNAGSAMYKIKINDQIVTVFNNHLESNRLTSEDRKFYENILSSGTDRQRLDSITDNIRKRLGPAYVKRASQARLLDSLIKKQGDDKIIVCGDFNDTPISYTYKTTKGNLKDSFAETGFGAGITYNENYFWFRIDYILHSNNIKAYNCTVDKVKYSDHYPVWTYLKPD